MNQQINFVNGQINQLNNIIFDFQILKQNSLYNNGNENSIKNDVIFELSIGNLGDFEINMKNEINNISNNSNNNINVINMKSEIQNLLNNFEFILEDSFDDNNASDDSIYNILKDEEKVILKKIVLNNKHNIEKILLDNYQIKYIKGINNEMINKINENENSKKFFKDLILRQIDSIANNEEKYNIDYLTILLVGRKGVGKTTLVNYILDLKKNNAHNNIDFIEKIKYLKLIEVIGI